MLAVSSLSKADFYCGKKRVQGITKVAKVTAFLNISRENLKLFVL